MACSGKRVSTPRVLEPIFGYYHSMASRKQENHYKNLVYFSRAVSSSPQSLCIVFFIFMNPSMGHIASFVQCIVIIVFLV